MVDTNVARAVDALRDPGAPKTYEARERWVREQAAQLDLRHFRPDLPGYSPRLVQQALYAFCSKSNRVARGDACSERAAPGAVKLATDTAHCGACGNACSVPPNATAACVVGQCGIGNCSAGFANCDMDATDGCEVKLATDAAHCGACGNACSAANATAACVVGQCGIGNCSAGFANCDMDATDGCEVKLATDAAHCGACDNYADTGGERHRPYLRREG